MERPPADEAESLSGCGRERVMRINPHFALEAHARTLPYKDKAHIEREVAALRRAGLQ